MRVVIVGAGHVGQTAVRSLADGHDCTVVDLDRARLEAVSATFDVRTVQGSGGRRETLLDADIDDADLMLACTSREEVNLVAAMLAGRLSSARTVVRTTDFDYVEAWREGDLPVDLLVSSEFETASAVARVLEIPGARHVDVFAGGEVLVLEFDVPGRGRPEFTGGRLEADLPAESRVFGILREDRPLVAGGDMSTSPGDRLIVAASRPAARDWGRLFTGMEPVDDVVVFGAGPVGTAIARVLLDRQMKVRLIEADGERARVAAEAVTDARVFHASGLDPEFLRRERIGDARAAVLATGDDSHNLHAAVLAGIHGVEVTLAVLEDPAAAEAFDAAGIDATIYPADETAEKMIRYTVEERVRQVTMLEDDRFEVLDIEVREEGEFAGRALDELPETMAVGAIIRGDAPLFPSSGEKLDPGDRAIVLTLPEHVAAVERAL